MVHMYGVALRNTVQLQVVKSSKKLTLCGEKNFTVAAMFLIT